MLRKLKELLGFPTDAEKAAAKTDTPKVFVDGHGDVREVVAPVSSTEPFPFPKGDKPEAKVEKKPRAKRTPKAEPAAKAPAKKPAAKKTAAAKKPVATKKPRQTKAQ